MQFTYAPAEDFVIVEDAPEAYRKPHEQPKVEPVKPLRGEKAWLYAVGGTIAFAASVMLLAASAKPDASLPVTILGGLVLLVVLASPVVLVVCLIVLLAKYVLKSTMREVDAERAER